MARFDVVGVFLDAPVQYLSGISDMELVRGAAEWRLYTAGPPGGGLLAFDPDGGAGVGLALIDRLALAEGVGLHAPVRLEQAVLDGRGGLLLSGAHAGRLTGVDLTPEGRLDAAMTLTGGAGGVVCAQAVVRLGAETYVYSNALFRPEIVGWRLDAGGFATRVSETTLPREVQGVDVTAMQSWVAGSKTYLVVLSNGTDAMRSYRVNPDGELVPVSTLGAGAGLGIAAPSAMTIVEMGGRDYALVTAAGSSSISVVRLEPDGQMTLTDHVVDTRDSRFQGAGAIATVTIDGRVYVMAGGSDDGITLMTLLPDGRLLQIGNQTREVGFPLDNITALTARVTEGVIDLFAAGEGTGLMRLRIDPGPVGGNRMGGAGADTLVGGDAGDMLAGGAGNDLLQGGFGRDILIAGDGADRLHGGAGADWFVLNGDGGGDTIHDYEPDVDRIDLSAWGRVHDVSALTIRHRSNGSVTIGYGAETLTLWPAAGLTIPRDAFRATDFFGLWHVLGDPVIEGLWLEATAADDRMIAGGGEDTLAGSAGADRMDGGGGFDLVDYARSADPLCADLDGGGAGRGWGLGDVFFDIEGIVGGMGDDTLMGSPGANLLGGGAGRDVLWGRGGGDTLAGGAGDDTLNGGGGDDRLIGGLGFDSACYALAVGGVTVDLGAPHRSLGIAASDAFDGIEALIGSAHADVLAGDDLVNALSGGDGDDGLHGRAGDDTLWGDAGRDTLDGGAGDDVLSGGEGFDVARFGGGVSLAVDLSRSGAQDTGQGRDALAGIEAVEGGSAGDRLTGDGAGNGLSGGTGNDSLAGGDGADSLNGGSGDDRMTGGAGMDWVMYTGMSAIRLTLRQAGGHAVGDGRDTLDGIENAGTGAGADRLAGSSGANILRSDDGDDWLAGFAGADWLAGGAGRDTVSGGTGNDRIDGGAGRDLAVFDAGSGTRVDLRRAVAQHTGVGLDRLTGIEDLCGGQGADRLTGDGGANALDGRGGADALAGLAGDDALAGGGGRDGPPGGSGADRLWGGAGRDRLDGGAGADSFVFSRGQDVVTDLRRGQGDRLVLDRDDFAFLHGLSEATIIRRYGVDRAQGVWLELGPHDRIEVQGMADLHALADALTVL